MSGADNNRRANVMARTIRTKVYKFNELSKEAKDKAIESFRDINTDYEWHDSVYEDFRLLCAEIGVDVDLGKTYFSGFSSQGDGASFTADIDVMELIDGIKDKKYLSHAPNIHEEVRSFTPSECNVDRRVLALINSGNIDINAYAKANDRYYSTKLEFDYHTYGTGNGRTIENIERELNNLESWIEDIIQELDNLLYRLLEKEYEYLTSDEAIIDTILANEYEFTRDGKQF